MTGSALDDAGCVLVVDDADDLRQLIALILRSSGFDVAEAASADAALAVHAERNVHTMLVDVQLGTTNGLDLIAALRSTPAGADARVVLMTASPRVDASALAALRVEQVLTKPVTIDDVVNAVRRPRTG